MYTISIDPGASGAIAILKNKDLIGVFDIPFQKVGKNKIMDIYATENLLCDLGVDHHNISAVVIEQVGAMSKGGKAQGANSNFSFGARFGEVCSWGLTLTDNLIFLLPASWKRSAGLIGQDKKQSAIMCSKIYPDQAELFVEKNNRCKDGNKYHDGRADAVLIGLLGTK